MMNSVKSLLLVVLAVSFLVSCNEGGADVKDAAREAIQQDPNAAAAANSSLSADPAAQVPAGPTTEITYEELEFDFGTVNEGEMVSHPYKFKNTGKEPLIISNAKGSCGCTVPKWPREPIPPGGSGEIMVEFNSAGKPGMQTKKVTITANTNPPQTFLTITGNVNKKAGDAAMPAQ